ncbi:MAG: QueT transporter family protein [Armatimonadota bacterium]|nr:MAG: QueT transporter family protein [Armatimonadota bacterium]
MRELFEVWRNTRLIVQVAVTAALYAAALIPFKPIPLIPGITEVRPANVIPIVCSLLFGPAAAWGTAFGNLIGDFFGTLGPGSIFGFVGNFLYGYVPYRIWAETGLLRPQQGSRSIGGRWLVEYLLVALLAGLVCAVVIGWGCELFGLWPGFLVATIIFLNNFIVAAVLGPGLLLALYPRVRRWGLLYWQVLGEEPVRASLRVRVGRLLCWAGCAAALVVGNSIAVHQPVGTEVLMGVAPFLGVVLVGVLLI